MSVHGYINFSRVFADHLLPGNRNHHGQTVPFLDDMIGAALLFSVALAVNVVPKLSGGANSMGAGTYPRANYLHDGSLIGAYTAHASGTSSVNIIRSTDNGTSWSQIGAATQRPTDGSDVDNPFPIQLSSGRLLVAFRNHDKNGAAYTFFRIIICSSDDQGKTWKYLSTPAENAASGVNGIWEPFLRNAHDGTLQLYYSKENNANDQISILRVSKDGGATWSAPMTISGAGLTGRDGMLGVATISGNNLMAVFETGANGQFTINSITSSDDGKTWGNRQHVYTPANKRNAGAPQIINVAGALVVSFMTDEDTPSGTWVDSPVAKLLTSGDGGKTWGNKFTWSQKDSFWPGLLHVGGTNFLGLVDHGGSKAQRITLN